jgi:hypothetical protein
MASVTSESDVCNVLDVLTVVMLEIPEPQLRKWRQMMDRADVAAKTRSGKFDRSQWGLQPHQIEQQRAALRTLGQGG